MTPTPQMEQVSTVDYHTAGEPFRIVLEGAPDLPGSDVASRREHAIGSPQVQRVRQLLCNEPRGHADMYGCFLVPPNDSGAHLGVVFWHKDGFSTACGHGSIALAAWAVESGRVPAPDDGNTEVRIDVPSGRVRVMVHTAGGAVTSVAFVNVPSWVMRRSVPVLLPAGVGRSRGSGGVEVAVDVAFGGAAYAFLPAGAVGLSVEPVNYQQLIVVGRAVRDALNRAGAARHPSDRRLSGIYGTVLYDELDISGLDGDPMPPGSVWQRNVAVFADGEVDRSPCGSGTSARIALLATDGRLPGEAVLVHDSIIDTRFVGRVLDTTTAHGRAAVVPEVVGMAYRTGSATFDVDPRDPLTPGFVLR